MAGRIESITNPRVSLTVLSPEEVRGIHMATLDVIESVGVRFPSERALDIWENHGASVDRDTSIVKVAGHIIEKALDKAPPSSNVSLKYMYWSYLSPIPPRIMMSTSAWRSSPTRR